jgi:hypothetical protein
LKGEIEMNYDDGYEELRLKPYNSDTHKTRAYKLSNGDIFTVKGKGKDYTLEYENKMLYEVVFKLDDQWLQSKWERTGVIFTPEELNKLITEIV